MSDETLACPECLGEVPAGARRCWRCRAPLPSEPDRLERHLADPDEPGIAVSDSFVRPMTIGRMDRHGRSIRPQ